ncbi:MAG: hypothetical protein HW380_2908 [Magnetococcales bacterium]|nr:hypothetical protein [Magnetococcales bacterium]
MKFKALKTALAIALLSAITVSGCASRVAPSFTFAFSKDSATKDETLVRHSENEITVQPGKTISIILDKFHPGAMNEANEARLGSLGNRELLFYAKIYKNGYFERYVTLVDLAKHVHSFQMAPIENQTLFTETIKDARYQIVLRAYEVDTETIVRVLRRAKQIDLNQIENEDFRPDKVFIDSA